MDPDDIKYIQKRVNSMSIDAHPTEDAIVVTYELEASLVGDFGDTMLEESKECQKIIRLKSLKQSNDLTSLAQEIVRKSGNLILVSQTDEVKRLLSYLKTRKDVPTQTATGTKLDHLRPKTASSRAENASPSSKQPLINASLDPTTDILDSLVRELKLADLEKPSVGDLDQYVELLYEDLQDKIKGALFLFQLAQSPDNLAELSTNETLLCALTRVLREDGRKSLELSALIVGTFACFSTYSQFHGVVSQYKLGSQCLDLIQWELAREESWFRELTELQAKPESASLASSMHLMTASCTSVSSAPPDISRGTASPTFSLMANDYDKSLRKYQHLVRKQNLLLQAAFYLLICLAEDKRVEIKMVNKGIVSLLVKTLEREASPEFFVTVVLFLKKLSIYAENKNQLQELGVVEKLYSLLSTSMSVGNNLQLISVILGVLVNLSFDMKLRVVMIKVGFIQKLIHLWSKERISAENSVVEHLVLQILYQMSRDDRVKEHFSFSLGSGVEAIDFIATRVMKATEPGSAVSSKLAAGKQKSKPLFLMELMALVINLAINLKNARIICAHDRLSKLLDRAVGTLASSEDAQLTNVLLLKLIRNLAQHEAEYKKTFIAYAEPLMKLVFLGSDQKAKGLTLEDLTSGNDNDMCETLTVECLGILGNLTNVSEIDWLKLFEKFHAFDWMKSRLKADSCSEDDLVLEIAIFLGTACSHPDCALRLIQKGLVNVLIELLNAKQEDDEIVLQVIYVFHVLSRHDETRDHIIKESQVPAYLIDLMNDKNAAINEVCSVTLNVIAEHDEEWAKRIQMEKFKAHNKQWLEMVQSSSHVTDFLDDYVEDVYGSPTNDDFNEYNFLMKPEMLNSSNDSDDSSHSGIALHDEDGFARGARQPAFMASRPTTGYKKRHNALSRIPCLASTSFGAFSAPRRHTLVATSLSCVESPSPVHPIFMPIRSRIDLSAPSSPRSTPCQYDSPHASGHIVLSG